MWSCRVCGLALLFLKKRFFKSHGIKLECSLLRTIDDFCQRLATAGLCKRGKKHQHAILARLPTYLFPVFKLNKSL